jgi:hypothetical protein
MIAGFGEDWEDLDCLPLWSYSQERTDSFTFLLGNTCLLKTNILIPLRDSIFKRYNIAIKCDIPTRAEFKIHHCTEENIKNRKVECASLKKLLGTFWLAVRVERHGCPNMYGLAAFWTEPRLNDCKLLLLCCPWYGLSESASSNHKELENFRKIQQSFNTMWKVPDTVTKKRKQPCS